MPDKAVYVLHHDDPPCEARLEESGRCPVCSLFPDTQSKALWSYCPDCRIPLKDWKCPTCKRTFVRP